MLVTSTFKWQMMPLQSMSWYLRAIAMHVASAAAIKKKRVRLPKACHGTLRRDLYDHDIQVTETSDIHYTHVAWRKSRRNSHCLVANSSKSKFRTQTCVFVFSIVAWSRHTVPIRLLWRPWGVTTRDVTAGSVQLSRAPMISLPRVSRRIWKSFALLIGLVFRR